MFPWLRFEPHFHAGVFHFLRRFLFLRLWRLLDRGMSFDALQIKGLVVIGSALRRDGLVYRVEGQCPSSVHPPKSHGKLTLSR